MKNQHPEEETTPAPKRNAFFSYLTSGYKGGFENEGVRKSLLINLFTHIALLSVFGFMIKAYLDNNVAYGSILMVFFFLCLGIILYLKFSKNYTVSAFFMSILMYLLCTIFIIVGGEQSTAILWNYTMPIVLFFSLGRKKGSFFAVFTYLTFVILLFFEPIHIAEYSKPFKVRFASSYAVVNLLLYVFEYIREKTYLAMVIANEKKTFYLSQVLQQKEEIIAQTEKLEEVNKELEKLSIVARETINAVSLFDANGRPIWVNEGFERMNGFGLKGFIEIVGDDLKKMGTTPEIRDVIKSCFEKKQPVTYSLPIKTGFGTRIWIQTSLTPILDPNGNIKQVIAIDTDISRIKEAEEEIQQQKEELEAQSELLLNANKELEKKNTLITDSINYAKLIQEALLPSEKILKRIFSDYFVLFKPRDIVSGDFYWLTETHESIFVAVVDCTGHGVPGAFMSLIGNSLLNQIVKEKNITSPSHILVALDKGVKEILSQGENENYTQDDGMDISICSILKGRNEICVASANQSVYLIIDKQIEIIEGEFCSIGGSRIMLDSYKEYQRKFNDEAIIYLCSDGFQDQFGGPTAGSGGKKFTEMNLKLALFEIHESEMTDQQKYLDATFNHWKGQCKQTDDVLVLGVKINGV